MEPRRRRRDDGGPDRGVRRHPRRRTRRPGRHHRACVRCAVRLRDVVPFDGGHFLPAAGGNFGNLIEVSVPSGYGAANPITGVFLDNWSELDWGWGPFKVSFQADSTGTPSVLPSCGGWSRTRSAVRVLDRPVVPVVEPLRVRRPPHRRAIHQRWNVRARPIGRARHRRGIVPYRPGASRLPVSFVAVVVGAAGVSGLIAPAAPARCLPPGFAPRRGPRARQTATVVAPRPKTAAAA